MASSLWSLAVVESLRSQRHFNAENRGKGELTSSLEQRAQECIAAAIEILVIQLRHFLAHVNNSTPSNRIET